MIVAWSAAAAWRTARRKVLAEVHVKHIQSRIAGRYHEFPRRKCRDIRDDDGK